MHTRCLSSEQPDQDCGDGHDDERRGYGRREMTKQQHGGEGQDAGQRRCERNVRQVLQDMPELREKVTRSTADAKQMRHLADDGDLDETFNEAPHHGCGNKACHPPHANQSKGEEKYADQNGEGRGERVEVGGPLRAGGSRAPGHARNMRSPLSSEWLRNADLAAALRSARQY